MISINFELISVNYGNYIQSKFKIDIYYFLVKKNVFYLYFVSSRT